VLEHAHVRSALAEFAAALPSFRRGGEIALELQEVAHAHIIELAQPRPGAAFAAILGKLGAERLPRTGESGSFDGSFLLGIGPERWLLIGSDAAASGSRGAALALGDAFEVSVEAGDAWAQFSIRGSAAIEFLAKGCVLDLHPSIFLPGSCAVTRFAQLRCILHRVPGGYRLLVGRSYASSLAEWLVEAAAEFSLGLENKAPAEAPSSDMRPCNHLT
jgi:sarcosine oxidase subunit gamma